MSHQSRKTNAQFNERSADSVGWHGKHRKRQPPVTDEKQQARRVALTPAQKEEQRIRDRAHYAEKMANETAEEREARLVKDRAQAAARRKRKREEKEAANGK